MDPGVQSISLSISDQSELRSLQQLLSMTPEVTVQRIPGGARAGRAGCT